MWTEEQLIVNRELTKWFISQNPVTVSLVPKGRQKSPSGGVKLVSLQAKPPQTVTFSQQGGSLVSLKTAEAGLNRRFEFVMIGEHDADFDVDDVFTDEKGHKWVILALEPFNGYEQKAYVVAYGKEL